MSMFVIVIDDEMKEIKNQRHSCIYHQMKYGSGDLREIRDKNKQRNLIMRSVQVGTLVVLKGSTI